MPVRKDKESEFKDWQRLMTEKGHKPIIRLAKWFFNLIDLNRLDIKSIIYIFCHTCELFEMFGIKDNDKWQIYIAIKAVVDYHDRGEEFRMTWNYYWLKVDAVEIEMRHREVNKKFTVNPYIK